MAPLVRALLLAPGLATRICLKHGDLLRQFTVRNIAGRYRGSILGMGWSIAHPLVMLAVYTFVFGIVFKSRFGQSNSDSCLDFSLALFAGLTVFNLFTESVNRACSIVRTNVNLVKKVVFPLELLCISLVGEGLFHYLISTTILVVGVGLFLHTLSWTLLLLPLVAIPLLLFVLGCAWILAATGVFFKDIDYSIAILTTVLFFLTPIFYPVSAVPERLQILIQLNPLAVFVDTCRRLVIWKMMPDWPWYLYATALSVAMFCLGFALFERTKRSFADVL